MDKVIPKTETSDELLAFLLRFPTDLSAIEKHLKEKNYTSDEISRAGYDYAYVCCEDFFDYCDAHSEEARYSDAAVIPDALSSNMLQIFELLLRYGLDPNAVCVYGSNTDTDCCGSIMACVTSVYNEYVAADTLALLIEHGGDPNRIVDDETLIDKIEMSVLFDAIELANRRMYDSIIHCWLVLLGYGAELGNIYIFAERRSECDLPDFKVEDLKDHRNYYYGISNAPGNGENWSLHIFDKRTRWEVLRL